MPPDAKRTSRIVAAATAVAALATPAALLAADAAVMSGRTAWGEDYRVLLRGGDEQCLTPQLQWSTAQAQELCLGGDGWFDAQVAERDDAPWLAFGVTPPTAARVRVVLADLSAGDAQIVDHPALPQARLFHLPSPAASPPVKLVEALDATGGVIDAETFEEGPFRRLRGGSLGGRRSWSFASGWSLAPGTHAPLACLRAGVEQRDRDGREAALITECTGATARRPWWMRAELADLRERKAGILLTGGVRDDVRRVDLELTGASRPRVSTPALGGARLAPVLRGRLRLWAVRLPPGDARARVRRIVGRDARGRVVFSRRPVRRLTSFQRFCRANRGAC